jgi:hypothetical protein
MLSMKDGIVSIAVDIVTETPAGLKRATITLEDMQRCCRPERVDELLEDVELLCKDVLAEVSPEASRLWIIR